MTDYSELLERLERRADLITTPVVYAEDADVADDIHLAATTIRTLLAERDAVHAKAWNEAIEAAAGFADQLHEGYREGFDQTEHGTRIYEELRVQAGTARHIADAIRALKP